MKWFYEIIERDDRFTYKHEYFQNEANAEKRLGEILLGRSNICIKMDTRLRKEYKYYLDPVYSTKPLTLIMSMVKFKDWES